MSAPGMWWGRCPTDGRLHAVAPCDVAAERDWTEALCAWRLPADVALFSAPDHGPQCVACHLGATADLESADLPVLVPFEQARRGTSER